MYRSGLGDVLNPTAGSALDCGLLAGGVFNKACWCLEWPSLCSKESYAAAYALAYPDLVYGTVPAASVPTSPPLTSSGTVDLAGGDLATVGATLPGSLAAGALSQSQSTVQDYMNQVGSTISNISAPGSDWLMWGLIAAGVVAVVLLAGGRKGRR